MPDLKEVPPRCSNWRDTERSLSGGYRRRRFCGLPQASELRCE
ncbi:hypothetical protein VB735_11030 [Halotia wernerae UHCC 0503]|nr:hypothetical protein [Halotia wernerae UHCC 0503]